SVGHGRGNDLEILREVHFPHSLGMLYSAFTAYVGFKVDSGEYKLMGLAPYGQPKYVDRILDRLVTQQEDGSFGLDMSYFHFATGLRMTNEKFHRLFEGPPRGPEDLLEQRHMDIAASIQSVTEKIVLGMCEPLARQTKCRNLCLAGGVALNCVANGK